MLKPTDKQKSKTFYFKCRSARLLSLNQILTNWERLNGHDVGWFVVIIVHRYRTKVIFISNIARQLIITLNGKNYANIRLQILKFRLRSQTISMYSGNFSAFRWFFVVCSIETNEKPRKRTIKQNNKWTWHVRTCPWCRYHKFPLRSNILI